MDGWEMMILALNLFSFCLFGLDKWKAQKGMWRIPEKTFLLLGAFMGAAGILLGMKLFRHKTRHSLFTFGMPLLLVLNMLCYYLILNQNTAGAFRGW